MIWKVGATMGAILPVVAAAAAMLVTPTLTPKLAHFSTNTGCYVSNEVPAP